MNKRYQTIKRVTITIDHDLKSGSVAIADAFAYCSRNGYRVISCGHKRLVGFHIDFSKYKIVAEKVVSADVK